jgi:hypothetical protein
LRGDGEMSWWKRLLGIDKEEVNKEVELLKKVIEDNSKAMQTMNTTINRLEDNLSQTKNEVAVTIEQERKRIAMEKEEERIREEQERELKQKKFTEKLVSLYLVKYLDQFDLVHSRFSLASNMEKINNQEELMFKVVQMIKLGQGRLDHTPVFQDHFIRLTIHGLKDIMYSVDGNSLYTNPSVGISVLRKFIQDISVEVMNIPCVMNNKIYRVYGRKYKYVLAKDEMNCYFILKDKEKKTKIELVDKVDNTAYVKSLKSHLIYSREMK